MLTDQDTKLLDRLAALNAARNCWEYGPVHAMNADMVEAVMLIQDVASKARAVNGLERPVIVPTKVSHDIAKALETLFWSRVAKLQAKELKQSANGSYGGEGYGEGGYSDESATGNSAA